MTFANGETIAAEVYEPMRTEETYYKIQELRKTRSKQFNSHTRMSTKNIHLLKFVPITCGYCGRVISVHQGGSKEHPRFITQHGRQKRLNGERCSISLNAKQYEYNLIKALKEILQSEELAKKYVEMETGDKGLQQLDKEFKKYNKALNKLNESKDKLLDLYITTDKLRKDVFTEKNMELENKIAIIKKNKEQAERKLNAMKKEEWTYENLSSYLRIAEDIGTRLTRHEQANLIGKIFTKAVITHDELRITTEVYSGIPVEIRVPVVDNTRTVNKWILRDKRNGAVIYTE